MNKVFLIGNIAKEPELTQATTGKSVCKFSIAVNRNYTMADGVKKTDFFNCIAWGGTGENIAKYCQKGSKIAINGSLEMRSYQDSKGIVRYSVEVVVSETEFLNRKPNPNVQPTQKANPPQEEYADDYNDMPF